MAASAFCLGSSSRANECKDDEGPAESHNQFTRYNILLGKGSCKQVYKGFDKHTGREVGWSKIELTPKMKETQKYEEAEMLMTLNHKNITKCHGYWIEGDYVNMITEYCSSGNLKEYIKKHKMVGNKALIKKWSRQILNAVGYLHSEDRGHPPYVHRDIKSDNIFINGHTGTVKLGDLGNAVKYDESEGITKSFMAADIYMFGLNGVAEMANKKLLNRNQWDSLFRPRGNFEKYMESFAPSGVKDAEIKDFIKRCSVHPPNTPSAMYLLENDPFLAVDDNPGVAVVVDTSTAVAAAVQNLIESVRDQVRLLLPPPTEFEVVKEFKTEDKKLRLQGNMSDTNFWVSTTLTIFHADLSVEKIEFEFFLGVDTAEEIITYMKEFEILPAHEIAPLLQNTERLITELQHKLHVTNTANKRKMPFLFLCNKF